MKVNAIQQGWVKYTFIIREDLKELLKSRKCLQKGIFTIKRDKKIFNSLKIIDEYSESSKLLVCTLVKNG